ncbi:tRNA(Ile)-lysidine synthase [Alicyclobacillus sacchari]|uniref:tRNA(Ile)-lysidine synthase n=1 Tax=Alicyclobacillus sacchari TaxID=392010 RepID=A0A4V3HEC1_9BACL|nr:tRNA lysidine(34) synthetase TilS [Alicyclobacillus sacchari]TDY46368.1 tRNA(Ile)-lysidine synthase [Alicyclobacillus sacchari]
MGAVFAPDIKECFGRADEEVGRRICYNDGYDTERRGQRLNNVQLEREFAQFCKTHQLQSAHAVIGVSGGVDSMVLLQLCHRAMHGSEPLLGGFSVVHVDHGLRPTSADDAQFVASYCSRLGVFCEVVPVEVKDCHGEGIEAAARRVRYEALLARARSYPHGVCLVAHHSRDQLETFVMRWLRGSGLAGLGAMRPAAIREGVPLLRPLLRVRRSEIVQYANMWDVPFREDETNANTRFFRNRVRHELLPLLAALQPAVEARTLDLTEQLQADESFLQEQAERALEQVVVRRSGHDVEISTEAFAGLHLSLQRRVIHILLNCFCARDWLFSHVESIRTLALRQDTASAAVSLPHGLGAWREYGRIYIGHQALPHDHETRGPRSIAQWDLVHVRQLSFASAGVFWRFRALPIAKLPPQPRRSPWRAYVPDVDFVEIVCGLPTSVRVRPLGLAGSKKLQDVFSDSKIPRRLRPGWPIVRVAGRIVWIPGAVRTDVQRWDDTGGGYALFARPSRFQD